MRATRLLAVVTTLLVTLTGLHAQVVEDTFDADAARWEPVVGDWRVEDGVYLQTDASSPDYRFSLFDTPWREGSIEVSATALERNDHGNVGATFGLMVKYLDADRWCAIRFGSYGSCNLIVRSPEDKRRIGLGSFSPEIDRTYRIGVILREGMLAVVRDGVVLAILDDPFPDTAARPGLFTETRATFDDVRLEVTE